VLVDLLVGLGAVVEGVGTPTLRIQCTRVLTGRPDPELVGKLRGSVLLLGPLLARYGSARLAPPGGDFPARRTISTHLQALIAMGAVPVDEPGHALDAPNGLRGASMYLDEASVTGTETAAPSTGYTFEPSPENMARWRRWWRMANVEQAVTFAALSFLTIVVLSMIAFSTVYGRPDLPQNAGFLRLQGEQMQVMIGPWFGALYWTIGVLSLFVAAMGIVDYTSRIGADVLKTVYLPHSAWSESRICIRGPTWSTSRVPVTKRLASTHDLRNHHHLVRCGRCRAGPFGQSACPVG
jgi:hypothetical protein